MYTLTYTYIVLLFPSLVGLPIQTKYSTDIYCMLLDSLILSQKMRHVKFNFIQRKMTTCSPSSGCANCCKIGPTYPQLGTG